MYGNPSNSSSTQPLTSRESDGSLGSRSGDTLMDGGGGGGGGGSGGGRGGGGGMGLVRAETSCDSKLWNLGGTINSAFRRSTSADLLCRFLGVGERV